MTAANAGAIRAHAAILLPVGAGAVALNALGYGLGYLLAARAVRPARVASILSVGTRDFAVAAALAVAAGLPPVASLPAVAFGVVEMTSSAGLSRWLAADG